MTIPPPPRTAYLHVPFCGHHCGYCDFAVTAGQDHLIELYLDAIQLELAAGGIPRPVETLFIGGGTPTYLDADQLRRFLTAVREWLPFVEGGRPEFSIESTPESLDADKIAVLAAFGVTRVSVGVQSFQPHLLAALDRRHGVEQIPRAVELVRRAGLELSFDLIFASPGQTLPEWAADLDAAVAFGPDHVSAYALTYETGTPLWKRRHRGEIPTTDDELELAMFLLAREKLSAAGYEAYEVSNFARPGRRCRHNERYWANDAYYGFGVGAARYVGGVRSMNTRDTKLYIRKVLAGEDPTFQREELPPRERALETAAVQLRRIQGVEREPFRLQTGFAFDDLAPARVAVLVQEGLLEDTGSAVRLTPRGVCVADGVAADLMKAVD